MPTDGSSTKTRRLPSAKTRGSRIAPRLATVSPALLLPDDRRLTVPSLSPVQSPPAATSARESGSVRSVPPTTYAQRPSTNGGADPRACPWVGRPGSRGRSRQATEWGEQDSNLRRRSQPVYSRSPLTTRASPRPRPILEGRAGTRGPLVAPYEASRKRRASGSIWSFLSVLFSIWRTRSRVTPKARPTSSSVRGSWLTSP